VALPVGREVAVFVEFLPEVGPPRLVGADEAVSWRVFVARSSLVRPTVTSPSSNARSNSAR
jgi:hypothetical protein